MSRQRLRLVGMVGMTFSIGLLSCSVWWSLTYPFHDTNIFRKKDKITVLQGQPFKTMSLSNMPIYSGGQSLAEDEEMPDAVLSDLDGNEISLKVEVYDSPPHIVLFGSITCWNTRRLVESLSELVKMGGVKAVKRGFFLFIPQSPIQDNILILMQARELNIRKP